MTGPQAAAQTAVPWAFQAQDLAPQGRLLQPTLAAAMSSDAGACLHGNLQVAKLHFVLVEANRSSRIDQSRIEP